jgi:wyosine [tRNA(Phe)-imidazoG37] synthetase (radical SAM superfamily)
MNMLFPREILSLSFEMGNKELCWFIKILSKIDLERIYHSKYMKSRKERLSLDFRIKLQFIAKAFVQFVSIIY